MKVVYEKGILQPSVFLSSPGACSPLTSHSYLHPNYTAIQPANSRGNERWTKAKTAQKSWGMKYIWDQFIMWELHTQNVSGAGSALCAIHTDVGELMYFLFLKWQSTARKVRFMNFQAWRLLADGLAVICRIKNLCVKVLDIEIARERTNLICMGKNYCYHYCYC